MANKKGNVRSDRRLADMSGPEPARFSPDMRGAREETWHDFMSADDRITWRTTRNGRGRLVDFSLTQWHRVGPEEDEWTEIVRVDAKHGEVHRHTFDSDGSKIVRRKYCDLNGYDDFDRGLRYAERTVIDRFDENLRRWQYGY
jgi:hypothetical protein